MKNTEKMTINSYETVAISYSKLEKFNKILNQFNLKLSGLNDYFDELIQSKL